MALTQLDYPVTGIQGDYRNVFASQNPVNINFNRKDILIASIASGTGGVVEITFGNNFDITLLAGDFITWNTASYGIRSSRVLAIISANTIEIDEVFFSTDTTNGWANYRKNWYVEARFVNSSTASGTQGVVDLVLKDFSQVPSGIDGNLSLDLSIVKDVLSPEFSITTEIVLGLSKQFKVQYRESYDGVREGLWISPPLDIPIMLVLSNKEVVFNDFVDSSLLQGKFAKSYPLILSYIYSDINDGGSSNLTFNLNQYTLDKQLILSSEIATFTDQSGVINLVVMPSAVFANTVFIGIDISSATSSSQYEPLDYEPLQYA